MPLTHRSHFDMTQGLGDKVGGLAEEVKGKVLGRPGLVEHGRERGTGERKEREHVRCVRPAGLIGYPYTV